MADLVKVEDARSHRGMLLVVADGFKEFLQYIEPFAVGAFDRPFGQFVRTRPFAHGWVEMIIISVRFDEAVNCPVKQFDGFGRLCGRLNRKSVVWCKEGSSRVDLGG